MPIFLMIVSGYGLVHLAAAVWWTRHGEITLEAFPRCARCGEMREWRHKCRDAEISVDLEGRRV